MLVADMPCGVEESWALVVGVHLVHVGSGMSFFEFLVLKCLFWACAAARHLPRRESRFTKNNCLYRERYPRNRPANHVGVGATSAFLGGLEYGGGVGRRNPPILPAQARCAEPLPLKAVETPLGL